MSTRARFFFCQLLTITQLFGILIMRMIPLFILNFFLFRDGACAPFFLLFIPAEHLTSPNRRDILSIVLNFVFFFSGATCAIFLSFPVEHLTIPNHRDILIIVRQMATLHLFF